MKKNSAKLLSLFLLTNGIANAHHNVDGPAALTSSSPYQLVINNSTAGTLTAVLFGRNKNASITGRGSATGITVTPGQSNLSYDEVLQQSANQPFECALMRISSSNTSQVTQSLSLTKTDASGDSTTKTILVDPYLSPDQYSNTRVDVPYPIIIDGSTQIAFPVLAGATVTISFFPNEKVNNARMLNGENALINYGTPKLGAGYNQISGHDTF